MGYMKRVLQMGEKPQYVFDVGCPELEFVQKLTADITAEDINWFGVGKPIDLDKPFLTVAFHPVTTESNNREHCAQILDVVHGMDVQAIWFWPNIDAGTDDVAKAIRVFREHTDAKHMHFIKYLTAEKYIALLKKTACLVGNSSAGIKECSYLGVPVVNIGSRQHGRMRGPNVIDTSYNLQEISEAIIRQLNHGPFEPSDLYFKEGCSENIARILAEADLYVQKEFYEESRILKITPFASGNIKTPVRRDALQSKSDG